MLLRLTALLLLASSAFAAIVQDVRSAIGSGDFAAGEKMIAEYRKKQGVTSEMILALSWLGRGALASKQYDRAGAYAAQTRQLVLEQIKKRAVDSDKDLPLALGASIEVQAQSQAARGERDQAVTFLKEEIARWKNTSIVTRLNKNLNLLSLEGKPAPELDITEFLGTKPSSMKQLKGRPVVLFLWAHWCGDCKYQVPILARLKKENPDLAIIGPTQPYGYAAGGQEVGRAEEVKYIDSVRRSEHYNALEMPVTVSERNFRNYGASTTPTLVLIDRAGIVRLYHPGKMTYEELAPKIAELSRRS